MSRSRWPRPPGVHAGPHTAPAARARRVTPTAHHRRCRCAVAAVLLLALVVFALGAPLPDDVHRRVQPDADAADPSSARLGHVRLGDSQAVRRPSLAQRAASGRRTASAKAVTPVVFSGAPLIASARGSRSREAGVCPCARSRTIAELLVPGDDGRGCDARR